MVLRIFCS